MAASTIPGRFGRRGLLLALLVAALAGCGSQTATQRAANDQEIARNILWRFHQDPGGRFRDVRVTCEDRVVFLEGRVGDPQDAAEAIRIAQSESRGGKIDSRLDVRPR
jgi:osmotically-inducible protein OsmY